MISLSKIDVLRSESSFKKKYGVFPQEQRNWAASGQDSERTLQDCSPKLSWKEAGTRH